MSKSSDTFDSDQIFSTSSAGSTKAASWMAFHRRNALCPTKGATSPFAQPAAKKRPISAEPSDRIEESEVYALREMHLLILRVKYAMPFSK